MLEETLKSLGLNVANKESISWIGFSPKANKPGMESMKSCFSNCLSCRSNCLSVSIVPDRRVKDGIPLAPIY